MEAQGNKNEIMKHTKNYMDAKWVIENPEKYDDRDVARANSFIEAYDEGYNKALSLGAVVGKSEQLVCEYCNDDAKPTCCDSCLGFMVNAEQKAN